MRYLIFIAMVFLIGCVSDFEKSVSDSMTKTFASHGKCVNQEKMVDDFRDKIEDVGCLEDSFTEKYIKIIPDGEWSAKGMCCFAIIDKLKYADQNFVGLSSSEVKKTDKKLVDDKPIIKTKYLVRLDKEWDCKDSVEYDLVLSECEKLE